VPCGLVAERILACAYSHRMTGQVGHLPARSSEKVRPPSPVPKSEGPGAPSLWLETVMGHPPPSTLSEDPLIAMNRAQFLIP
jgi:hypothetical protein